MTGRVTIRQESWPLEKPFAISRGTKTAAEVVVVEIERNGHRGRGECVPYARYGETVDSVITALVEAEPALRSARQPGDIQHLFPAGAARNAADCALWDLRAKTSGCPVWQLAGLPPPRDHVTAYTISLASPVAMGEAAAEARDRPLLKLKLDGNEPVACVEAVRRGAPNARLVADANESWSIAQLNDVAPALVLAGVELIEQPVPAAHDGELAGWDGPALLCADESFHVAGDIPALAGRYRAINIKLDKAGGLTEALHCLQAAEAAGLTIMVGCMVATSLAMAPASLLAGGAAYVDLDGPLLLAKDRPHGIAFLPGSVMQPPSPSLWGA